MLESRKSSDIYAADIKRFFSNSTFLDSIPRIVKNFEARTKTMSFNPEITAKNPLILDLGCGDFPHYYKMFDYYGDNFKYVGVEKYMDKDVTKFAESVKKFHDNFSILPKSITDINLDRKVEGLTGRRTVDVILAEHLAVGDSDNSETDHLLDYIINNLAPQILAPNGILHFEAASVRQQEVIKELLDSQEPKIFHYTQDHGNFTCARDPSLLKELKNVEEITR